MAKISMEVRSGTARFAVAVRFHIIGAPSIVAARHPDGVAKVGSPIGREGLLVEDRAA